MRRRKNNEKRVLVSPRDNRSKNKRKFRRNNHNNNPRSYRSNNKKPKKTNRLTLFLMIIALVAFVAGAGFGISLSLDDGSDAPHVENVTKEMTSNLNNTTHVYYDEELDDLDFNDDETLKEFNITENASSY